jgi:hypothetical protein
MRDAGQPGVKGASSDTGFWRACESANDNGDAGSMTKERRKLRKKLVALKKQVAESTQNLQVGPQFTSAMRLKAP